MKKQSKKTKHYAQKFSVQKAPFQKKRYKTNHQFIRVIPKYTHVACIQVLGIMLTKKIWTGKVKVGWIWNP